MLKLLNYANNWNYEMESECPTFFLGIQVKDSVWTKVETYWISLFTGYFLASVVPNDTLLKDLLNLTYCSVWNFGENHTKNDNSYSNFCCILFEDCCKHINILRILNY